MKKNLLAGVFFLTISVLVVSIWFKDGLLYGGGDVGLPEYNPARILEILKFIWWDVSATGFLRPSGVTGIPLYSTLAIFDNLGLSYVSIQTLIFGAALFFAGFGMYLLAKSYFGEKGSVLAIVSGVFYVFNAFSMVQIWHRFVRPGFYLIAILPLLFILWRVWIKKGTYWSLFVFLLINFLFSFVFSTLGYVMALWILLTLYAASKTFIPWKGIATFKSVSGKFIKGLILWLITGFWWIYPFSTSGPALLSKQHTVYESVINVLSLSTQSIIPYSIAGLNPFYLFEEADFGIIYSTPLFLIIPYIVTITVFVGLLVSLRKRRFAFLGLLFTISLFIAKGAAAPFGNLFTWLFEKSFFFGVIRSPFEKLGLLMAFSSAILFSIGIRKILTFGKKKTLKAMSVGFVLMLIFGFGTYTWPMWKGKIFGKFDNPAYIEVPQSYKDADKYLVEREKTGRILHLPLTEGDGIIYNWQYGYHGAEPSDLLFTYPSIAHGLGLNSLDDIIKGLILMFRQIDGINDTNLARLLNALNVQYIVLHKDVDWVPGGWDSPERLEKSIDTRSIFSKVKVFDDLVIYEVNYEKRDKILLVSSGEYIGIGENNLFWPWMAPDKGNVFLSPIVQADSTFVAENSSGFLLTPQTVIITPARQLAFKESVRAELPYVRFLPNSPFYNLIRIKEGLELVKQPIRRRFWTRLTFAGKRLIEMNDLAEGVSISANSISRYKEAMNKTLDEMEARGLKTIQPKEQFIIKKTFANHILILNELIDTIPKDSKESPAISDLLTNLRVRLADLGFIPFYQMDSFNRHVNRFSVPVSGEYEIILAEQESSALYGGLESLNFQVDDKLMELTGKKEGNFIYYGKVYLVEGMHELNYERKESKEVAETGSAAAIDNGKSYQLDSGKHESVSISWQIPDFRPDSLYAASFEYWVRNGAGPILQVVHDTDPEDRKRPREKIRVLDTAFEPNDYNFYWYEARETFAPRVNASSLDIKFIVEPWNNCKNVLLKRCEDEEVRRGFDRPSSVLMRNVKITRELVNPMFLKLSSTKEPFINAVEFEKISPTYYTGLANIESSTFFVFAETYHPGWTLTLENDNGGKKVVERRFLADLYANAWYIEEPGNFQFELEFVPQQRVKKGAVVSIVGGLFIGFQAVIKRRKR